MEYIVFAILLVIGVALVYTALHGTTGQVFSALTGSSSSSSSSSKPSTSSTSKSTGKLKAAA